MNIPIPFWSFEIYTIIIEHWILLYIMTGLLVCIHLYIITKDDDTSDISTSFIFGMYITTFIFWWAMIIVFAFAKKSLSDDDDKRIEELEKKLKKRVKRK